MAALSVKSLGKTYGATEALAGIDLEVAEGELLGLLGPNGAGKSTLTKVACGLVHPTSGEARVCGHQPGSRDANAAQGYLAELFRFPDWLSALEVLELHQDLAGSGGGPDEREQLLEVVGLGDEGTRRVATMSKGMQQRLGIAQALIGDPRILMLDEPTSALDPAGRRTVRKLLLDLRERGVAVMLSSHLLSEVELICDRVAILYEGKVVAEGTPDELTGGAGVQVETASGMKSYPKVPREGIPRLVEELIGKGEQIYAVRTTGSTLEDFYIETVGEGEG